MLYRDELTRGESVGTYIRCDAAGYNFFELLLDERLCERELYIPADMVRKAGGINTALAEKRNYELMLRIAEFSGIAFADEKEDTEYIKMEASPVSDVAEGLKTDCYIAAKYKERLIEAELFNPVLENIIAEAEKTGLKDEIVGILEEFISGGESYIKLDRCTKPILIFKGNDPCYNVLNTFADEFAKAVEKKGYQTLFFDVDEEDWKEIVRYSGAEFKAVVGFQTYLFSVKMKDGISYFADNINAPKYNFLFDAPICFDNHLGYKAKDYTILTHDINYKNFLEKYYEQRALILPPGGMAQAATDADISFTDRKYALSFLGSYGDYREVLAEISGYETDKRDLALELFELLKDKPCLTLEAGFDEVLESRNIQLNRVEYVRVLRIIRNVLYAASFYFREKAVETILAADIELDVFGKSFEKAPFAKHKNLRIHEDIPAEKSLCVYRNSKLSLNFMTWHKAGVTERMANIMLSGAVLVTDHTDGFTEGEGESFAEYRLSHIEELPLIIKRLLADEKSAEKMAKKGRERAEAFLSWDKRAEEFLAQEAL